LKYASVTVTFLFLAISSSFSQLRWKQVTDEFAPLPKSIKVFKTTDSLNGRPFIAYYLEARLKDKKLEFTTQIGEGKRYTPTQYYALQDSPLVVVNGSFFSFQTNQNLNVIMKDSRMISYNVAALKSKNSDSFYYPTRSAIGISKKRRPDVAWIFTDTAQQWPYAFQKQPIIAKGVTSDPAIHDLNTIDLWKWWKMKTAMGGGPMLVQEGVIYITYKEEQMFLNGEQDKHPRTAMGYTDRKRLIILMVQGRFPGIAEGATLQEEAKILVDLGCVEALNLDGGGSSCMLVNGKETIKPSEKEGQRPVPGVFLIKKRSKSARTP
jgi:Phosphodiester glycosidase